MDLADIFAGLASGAGTGLNTYMALSQLERQRAGDAEDRDWRAQQRRDADRTRLARETERTFGNLQRTAAAERAQVGERQRRHALLSALGPDVAPRAAALSPEQLERLVVGDLTPKPDAAPRRWVPTTREEALAYERDRAAIPTRQRAAAPKRTSATAGPSTREKPLTATQRRGIAFWGQKHDPALARRMEDHFRRLRADMPDAHHGDVMAEVERLVTAESRAQERATPKGADAALAAALERRRQERDGGVARPAATPGARGNIDLRAETPAPAADGKPISAADAAKARTDPAFAAWLRTNGYAVPE